MCHPGFRLLCALLAVCAPLSAAHAFCGFYVASGESKLFNHRSQVVLVRDGDRTVLTMASDYEGDPKEFALVVPVPVVLKRGQIHVGDSSLVGKLDAYSAPRLVEYHDEDPCQDAMRVRTLSIGIGSLQEVRVSATKFMDQVRIEARYEVDEYDVLILSADDSGALLRWLTAHHYRVPMQASRVVDSYLKQGMKFFVAKVDLRRRAERGLTQLRPLQIAYESPRFMLPVRLGMVNGNGPQELFVYAITRQGRVEPVNYRSLKLPEAVDVPAFVKGDFSTVWRAAFDQLVRKHGMGVVYTEYAWDMTWCDPCPSPALTREEQQALGVWCWASPTRACSSPDCTHATTASRSPRTSCCRPPPTARTSSAASSCATSGRAKRGARAPIRTVRACPHAVSGRRPRSRNSRAGRSPTCAGACTPAPLGRSRANR